MLNQKPKLKKYKAFHYLRIVKIVTLLKTPTQEFLSRNISVGY